jgi:methylthioribose-1-phosphate isomerase
MDIHKRIPLIFGVPEPSFYDRLKEKRVFVAELRPGLEGAQVVAKELLKRGIQPVIICDNMLAFCMKRGLVKEVAIFYTALNKNVSLCRTGSLIAALCAKIHKIPVLLSKAGWIVQKRPVSILKIGGKKVTSQDLKNYVPLLEEVPLELGKGK